MSTNKKRFQVSFTEEQFKELTFAALKKGLTKSSLLSVVFDEWLEDQENNQKG
ncbi:CopG family transcriptional regulator [Streptococcus uberis]|uniref:CopG family transcriptional regulator n=1 Tax=Streptococcus uberis TaxID=1349 RepID=UPI00336536F4